MDDIRKLACRHFADPAIALPAIIGGCCVMSRLHIYRYLRKLALPVGIISVLFRILSAPSYHDSLLQLFAKASNSSRVVGDLLGLLLGYSLFTLGSAAMATSLGSIKNGVIDASYALAKNLPMVKKELDKEKKALEESMDKELKTKSRSYGEVFSEIPEMGVSEDRILSLMTRASSEENKMWQSGKVSGGIYHGGDKHVELLNKAFSLYSLANPLHADIWASGMKFESEVIAMTASLMTSRPLADTTLCGSTTSGGTESIVLAAKAHRDYYRSQYGITQPEIIACVSAHAAIEKACALLSIKLVQVPMDAQTFKVDMVALRRAIGPNTIMLYSSAPQFPQGVIDPIAQLSDLAVKYSIGLHVDCCLGGFILPFAKKLGYSIPAFDFDLPGVSSMSVDTHKYGYALKGASVVLYANHEIRRAQYFCFADWTGGMYTTPTIAGSRSTGLISQCWASLVSIGISGFMENTKKIMDTAQLIGEGVRAIEGIEVIGAVEVMIVCFRVHASYSKDINVYNIADKMAKKGWSLNSLQNPASIHLCCTLQHVGREDLFLSDLRAAVKETLEAGAGGEGGKAAVYGMAATLPAGPLDEMLQCYNDVIYKL